MSEPAFSTFLPGRASRHANYMQAFVNQYETGHQSVLRPICKDRVRNSAQTLLCIILFVLSYKKLIRHRGSQVILVGGHWGPDKQMRFVEYGEIYPLRSKDF